MDRLAFFQLLVLLLAMPAQYLISVYWSHDTLQRTSALKEYFQIVLNISASSIQYSLPGLHGLMNIVDSRFLPGSN
jgi:hypothetical protein